MPSPFPMHRFSFTTASSPLWVITYTFIRTRRRDAPHHIQQTSDMIGNDRFDHLLALNLERGR